MTSPFFTIDSRFSIAAAFDVKTARHSLALTDEAKIRTIREEQEAGKIRSMSLEEKWK
jgi:hypothetical protein